MNRVKIEIEGEIVGKGRPRFTRTGNVYTPVRTMLYEKQIRKAFIETGASMFEGAVYVEIEAVFGVQRSATKKQREARLKGEELAIRKPDVDNIAKIVLDALNGLAWKDDAQVVSIRVIKGRYEEKPRLLCRISDTDPQTIQAAHYLMFEKED